MFSNFTEIMGIILIIFNISLIIHIRGINHEQKRWIQSKTEHY